MNSRRRLTLPFILALLLSLTSCSVAPHGKTVVLRRPSPSATATPAVPGKLSFELEKATVIPAQDFDQTGYFMSPAAQLVFGWLDDDHLAAIGTAPVATDTEPEATPKARQPQAKPGYPASAAGLVGQILSVDWQTGKAEELHTVQGQVITMMGLSHDKSKLWYRSTDAAGSSRLYVSDVSFRHVLLEVADFLGYMPFWSSSDKYLGYLDFKKSRPFLTLFDGVKSRSFQVPEPLDFSSYLWIDDNGDNVMSFYRGMLLTTFPLSQPGKFSTEKMPAMLDPITMKRGLEMGAAEQPVWTGDGLLLYPGSGGDGRRLVAVDLQTMVVANEYDGVLNFALSDDGKYVCLVREAAVGSADIYVGEWDGGGISNEKLVFKGFNADGSIFFSPDDAKLYVEGNDELTGEKKSMVLKFK